MFSVDHYLHSIKVNLESQSDVLAGSLKKILARPFSTEVDLVDFSAFIEPTRFELSITLFSMDNDANEVFNDGNDTSTFAGSEEILSDIQYYQIADKQLDEFFQFYEHNEDVLVPGEQRIIAEWFSDNWKKANGDLFNLPAYFTFHDDRSFDLRNNQWTNDEEKWS
ncbi:hypothetical protein [Cytobacillus gottheilii]|uniref:hypothetical protein n=1 Tax=Cytobacillus gottheilii TaxID=859144 RepID=UPI002147FDFA|nr:hypothetical protein [Cytobacillus gottheilii]